MPIISYPYSCPCATRTPERWTITRYQCLPAYDTCRLVGVAWQVLGPPPGMEVLGKGVAVVRPDGFDIPEDVVAIHGISTERAMQVRAARCTRGQAVGAKRGASGHVCVYVCWRRGSLNGQVQR